MDLQRFLEQDVPECYFSMAVIQAATDYYLFYESWAGEPKEDGVRSHSLDELPFADDFAARTSELVNSFYTGAATDNKAFSDKAFALREEIKSRALSIATYTDVMRMYEFLLNRLKPVDASSLKPIDNDIASRDVLSAIFKTGDNAVINDNIRTAVRELPLRMTKARFFDILENSLRKYIDTDASSLEREIYMLRSSAGIYERGEVPLKEVDDAIAYFEELDLSEMTDETYEAAAGHLLNCMKLLTDIGEVLQSLEHIVNLLCVLAITADRVEDEFYDDATGMRVLTDEAYQGLISGVAGEMSEEALSCFGALEGRFESLGDKLSRIQAKVATAYKGNLEVDTPAVLAELDKCERLFSPSVFADLEDEETSTLSEKDVLDSFNKLKNELSGCFTKDSKPVVRARMAAILSQLPVFFDSRTEVMNYVRESLEGCRDLYTKMVSVRLLLDAINNPE